MRKVIHGVLVFALLAAAAPRRVSADEHVVSPVDLEKAILDSGETRTARFDAIREFLASQPATRVLESAKVDSVKVEQAVARLDDEELARLALLAEKLDSDFSGGAALSDHKLLILIFVLIAGAFIVFVAAGG
jgi:predicted transcriptional regulator